jgi:hypothetical protein
MPKLYPPGQVATRNIAVDDYPRTSNRPRWLIIRGTAKAGQQELLIAEDAARELLAKLQELLLPIEDVE